MTDRVNEPRRSIRALRSISRGGLKALAVGAFLTLGFGHVSANAATTGMVGLGEASTYAVLSGASVGNTVSAVGAPHTTIRGDLGVKANTAPGGFPPGVVTGAIRFGSTVDQAHAGMVSAYDEISSRPGGTPLDGALAGARIPPGLHAIAGAASNTGTVTLDGEGDPDAVFVFQVNGALSFAAGSQVVLANEARASRVFWQVNGAGAVGADGGFTGTLIAMDAIAMGNGTVVNGRAFARNGALTLDNNQFFSAPPAVTIDGGESVHTTDPAPTIRGTTDVEAPATVTVTVAGQTLTATPVDGIWSVTSMALANGTYPVSVAVRDGAGNPGTATQQLTIDTVPPEITLEGGPSVTTNDRTPTIAGTSDAAAGTFVRVTVASQSLVAVVHVGGTWNVRAAALTDGHHPVTASVSDPAGNESSASQNLSIDTTGPVVAISGGPEALTNDATPRISGSVDVDPGSLVSVYVANETVTGTVGDGGWSVTAAELPDGPHRVVVRVADAAGNRARATQMLTVDTAAPRITIDGGATAATRQARPTLAGTSDGAPGATITVSIGGRSMTTLLQPNGRWNTNAGAVADGRWTVQASVRDPAGNSGTAVQSLSKDTKAPNTRITKRPRKQTFQQRVAFRFASPEKGSTFKCRIDGKPFRACRSLVKYKVRRGVHTFRVRAIDPAGNADPTPATYRFRVRVR